MGQKNMKKIEIEMRKMMVSFVRKVRYGAYVKLWKKAVKKL